MVTKINKPVPHCDIASNSLSTKCFSWMCRKIFSGEQGAYQRIIEWSPHPDCWLSLHQIFYLIESNRFAWRAAGRWRRGRTVTSTRRDAIPSEHQKITLPFPRAGSVRSKIPKSRSNFEDNASEFDVELTSCDLSTSESRARVLAFYRYPL